MVRDEMFLELTGTNGFLQIFDGALLAAEVWALLMMQPA